MTAVLRALLAGVVGATHLFAQPGDAPSSKFNIPGQARTRDCVPIKGPKVPLRYADGTLTGWFVNGDDPSKLSSRHQPCSPGAAEMDLHEVLTNASGMKLYFRPGGGGSLYREPVESGQYGHIAATDLAIVPQPAGSLNGKAAPVKGVEYLITPTRIPRGMYYKPNVSNGRSGSTYYTYGNPGYDKTGGRGDWTYINWSWVQNGAATYPASRCPGGGMVRALGKRGDLFQACKVEPIIGYSFGTDNQVNGRVTVFYGRMFAGPGGKGSAIYGWMPHSYQKTGDIIVPCVRRSHVDAPPGTIHNSATNRMERMAMNLVYPIQPNEHARNALRVRYFASQDPEARMEIITELSRMDDSSTVTLLLKLLGTEKTPRVREQIIVVAAFLASAEQNISAITEAFAHNYDRTTNEREKLRTLDVISNFASQRSVRFLKDAWRRGGAQEVRSALADAFLKLGSSPLLDDGLLGEARRFRENNPVTVERPDPGEDS